MKSIISSAFLLAAIHLSTTQVYATPSAKFGPEFRWKTVPCVLYNGKPDDAGEQHFRWDRINDFIPQQPIKAMLDPKLPFTIQGQEGHFTILLNSNWAGGKGTYLRMQSEANDFMALQPYNQFKVTFNTLNGSDYTFWMSTNTYCQADETTLPFNWKDVKSATLYQKNPIV
jgi:hypothetical protein